MEIKYQRILRAAYNTPWAILPEKLAGILNFLELRAAGMRLTDEEIQAITAARPAPRGVGSIAVLPVFGTIAYRANMFSEASGGTSIQKLTAQFRQALADPSVKAIVFDVDSPGGSVEGVDELASEIYSARGTKKIVAVANTIAASAAYWLASAAEEFSVTPSGEVGSIGVFAAHEDDSELLTSMGVKMTLVSAGKFKTEGNPFEPLSDEARAALQSRVDEYYGMFVKAVARNRGVTETSVRKGFGEGRMVGAKQAKAEGMVDRVATLDETLERFGVRVPAPAMSAEITMPEVVAAAPEVQDQVSDQPAPAKSIDVRRRLHQLDQVR